MSIERLCIWDTKQLENYFILEECNMKKMKRLVAVLLVGIMALAVLTACSGGGAPKSTENQLADIYQSAMNAMFGTELSNDSTLAARSKIALNSNINDAGELIGSSIIAGKPDTAGKVLVTLISDEGMTSAEVQKMISDPDAVKAYISLIKLEMKNEMGASYDIYVAMMKAAITGMGAGAVKKGDNYYLAVTMQVPKEVADSMRG